MKLTQVEQFLVSHVVDGTVFDLAPRAGDDLVNEASMRSWGTEHEIRAQVLREILRGRYVSKFGPDPHGVEVHGARIVGRLDLDFLVTPSPLTLRSCHLPDGLSGTSCVLPGLDLSGSIISVPTDDADQGAVNLQEAQIGGYLSLRGAKLVNASGPAMQADRLTVRTSLFLDEGFMASGRGNVGAVRLLGAHVGGQLSMRGAKLDNDSGPALVIDGVTVGGEMFCDEGFAASGYGDEGAVRFPGAHIGRLLSMRGAELNNSLGPALIADGLTVGGEASFDGVIAAARDDQGAVRLPGAHIAGTLSMSNAKLMNDSGPALSAEHIAVDGGMMMDKGFAAFGHGGMGAVRIPGGRIGTQLSMRGAALTNHAGPGLFAESLTVNADAVLDFGFSAIGHADLGAVRLSGAHVHGQLSMRGAALTNDAGPALSAEGLTVGGDALLDDGFSAEGCGDSGAVSLAGARVAGKLKVDADSVGRAVAGMKWDIDGLVYDGYPSAGYDQWLRLLREGTLAYTPQPYQQLASAARAAGHESDARRAVIAQRDDQMKRGKPTHSAKMWARFIKFALGYGYQPWRALIGIAALLFVSSMIAFLVPCALAHSETGTPCTGIETLQVAVDMAIPLVSTSAGSTCRITSAPGGQFVAWIGVVVSLSGWALTALFAAGFTSAIRRP